MGSSPKFTLSIMSPNFSSTSKAPLLIRRGSGSGTLRCFDSLSRRLFNHPMGLLKITEEEFSGPPFNVLIELLLGLVLCMWAALTLPGNFLSIHPHSEDNRIVSLPANVDFMIFNHRGKVFPVEMDLKLRQ